MPLKKVKGGYKYGSKGKVYKQRSKAAKQGKTIKASKKKEIRQNKEVIKWQDQKQESMII